MSPPAASLSRTRRTCTRGTSCCSPPATAPRTPSAARGSTAAAPAPRRPRNRTGKWRRRCRGWTGTARGTGTGRRDGGIAGWWRVGGMSTRGRWTLTAQFGGCVAGTAVIPTRPRRAAPLLPPTHLSPPSRGPAKVLRGRASNTSCGRGREGTTHAVWSRYGYTRPPATPNQLPLPCGRLQAPHRAS